LDQQGVITGDLFGKPQKCHRRATGCRLFEQLEDLIHDIGWQRFVHPPHPPNSDVVRQANEYE